MEQIVQLTCQRCGHSWIPNVPNPIVCSRCHSPYWRTPRKNNRQFAQVKQTVPNTIHTEPLMTETPQIPTPQYIPIYQPPVPQYAPPPVDYGVPPVRFPYPQETKIIYNEPPVFKSHEEEFHINPDRDMPNPLRKCKKCGYKGYGDYYRNHQCRR
jgi:hypothetical protein